MAKTRRPARHRPARHQAQLRSHRPPVRSSRRPPPQPIRRPTIPFACTERILLVSDGDLSFACSLLQHHGCTRLMVTVFEKEDELAIKYPETAPANVQALTAAAVPLRFGLDITQPKPWSWACEGPHRRGTMDRIICNFPHVGGKTTDVNRQVRYNQELLVAFFARALPCLAPTHGASIIVTLFDGEPYTLWNIRDLARHSGLEVARSFPFHASEYPGYQHVRTLGIVKGRNGEAGGGWKGEERPARSYEFVRNGEGPAGAASRKKEKKEEEESSSDMEN
ncbi:unnamed protein product [Blumeria hordei]|uniref:25S rRNA (uridine-N(3))-methyltransferase BMT5-like domain-containing protein n=2 Tax=Blumeria hordei TaxID=2867405 RepID=A0A383V134_BLUHO|nr:prodicted protein [Blumeria hordei DH14]SZF05699.1 unnamed protein product [Blumeria hordei]